MSRELLALQTNPAYSEENRAVALALGSPKDPTLASYFGGVGAASGVIVNEQTALNYSAVFACLNIISSSLAMMPKCVYRRGADDSRTEDRDHNIYKIIDQRPNEHMTPFVFWQLMHHWAPSWGNAYAEIERTKAGTPVALWPIHPSRVRPVKLDGGNNAMGYEVFRPYGGTSLIEAVDMLHILGPSYDGYFGYSIIAMARECIGLGLAQEKFGATFYGNNCQPGSLLEHPRKLLPEARKNLRESIENLHKGPHNANRLMILEEGMKLSPWSLPPKDAELLGSRKFQLEDVCRWFNVPPHMVYSLDRATLNNIEWLGTDFVRYTLSPWATRCEQEINRKAFNATEQKTYYTKYEFDELQRGDKASRYSSYATGRQWGWLSANDVRKEEHMNPIADGDQYMAPGNMTPIDKLGQQVGKLPAGPPSQPIKPPEKPGNVPQDYQRSAREWYAEMRKAS